MQGRQAVTSWLQGLASGGDVRYQPSRGPREKQVEDLRALLQALPAPFGRHDRVGVKLHWGERGNTSHLPPDFAREVVRWLQARGCAPFVFDTTVLYSGGRRTAKDSLATAAAHGFTERFLGCPLVVADGPDGRAVMEIPAGYRHFAAVQVADLLDRTEGFVLFSHFKGHLATLFGGAVKNLSMGFSSRAHKQRMHADARPILKKNKCTRCGACIALCPAGAAAAGRDGFPVYDAGLCIGCCQCIASCPEVALKIIWGTNREAFQERLVETAAALWRRIGDRTVAINALLRMTRNCDCMTGNNPVLAPDRGFVSGNHPVAVDAVSLTKAGVAAFERVHPGVPWQRQFSYAREIGFDGQAP